MVHLLNNFMLIVLTSINFSCHTLADWLLPPFSEPQRPESNTSLQCHKWILFYEFEESSSVNRFRARNRKTDYDVHVSEFAVFYAHVLVLFSNTGEIDRTENWAHLTSYTPWKYCKEIGMQSENYSFKAFGETQKTCEEWIYPYRYKRGTKKENLKYARSREVNEDGNISIWAAVYARYITEKEPISVPDFCSGMGLSFPMFFMSLNVTTMSCREWIWLSEYENNVGLNMDKAKLQKKRFYDYINRLTKLYIKYLLSFVPKKKLFGWTGASSSSSAPGASSSSSAPVTDDDNGPKTPEDFCDDNKMFDEIPFDYFGNRLD